METYFSLCTGYKLNKQNFNWKPLTVCVLMMVYVVNGSNYAVTF